MKENEAMKPANLTDSSLKVANENPELCGTSIKQEVSETFNSPFIKTNLNSKQDGCHRSLCHNDQTSVASTYSYKFQSNSVFTSSDKPELGNALRIPDKTQPKDALSKCDRVPLIDAFAYFDALPAPISALAYFDNTQRKDALVHSGHTELKGALTYFDNIRLTGDLKHSSDTESSSALAYSSINNCQPVSTVACTKSPKKQFNKNMDDFDQCHVTQNKRSKNKLADFAADLRSPTLGLLPFVKTELNTETNYCVAKYVSEDVIKKLIGTEKNHAKPVSSSFVKNGQSPIYNLVPFMKSEPDTESHVTSDIIEISYEPGSGCARTNPHDSRTKRVVGFSESFEEKIPNHSSPVNNLFSNCCNRQRKNSSSKTDLEHVDNNIKLTRKMLVPYVDLTLDESSCQYEEENTKVTEEIKSEENVKEEKSPSNILVPYMKSEIVELSYQDGEKVESGVFMKEGIKSEENRVGSCDLVKKEPLRTLNLVSPINSAFDIKSHDLTKDINEVSSGSTESDNSFEGFRDDIHSSCASCNIKRFDMEWILSDQKTGQYNLGRKVLKCEHCSKTFLRSACLKYHILKTHTSSLLSRTHEEQAFNQSEFTQNNYSNFKLVKAMVNEKDVSRTTKLQSPSGEHLDEGIKLAKHDHTLKTHTSSLISRTHKEKAFNQSEFTQNNYSNFKSVKARVNDKVVSGTTEFQSASSEWLHIVKKASKHVAKDDPKNIVDKLNITTETFVPEKSSAIKAATPSFSCVYCDKHFDSEWILSCHVTVKHSSIGKQCSGNSFSTESVKNVIFCAKVRTAIPDESSLISCNKRLHLFSKKRDEKTAETVDSLIAAEVAKRASTADKTSETIDQPLRKLLNVNEDKYQMGIASSVKQTVDVSHRLSNDKIDDAAQSAETVDSLPSVKYAKHASTADKTSETIDQPLRKLLKVNEDKYEMGIASNVKQILDVSHRLSNDKIADDAAYITVESFGTKRYLCPICPSMFKTEDDFNQHFVCHVQARSFQCPDCSPTFETKCSLTMHMISHKKSRDFRCSICKVTFLRKTKFVTHCCLKKRGWRHKCQICSCTFFKKSSLQVHMFTHKEALPWTFHIYG